MAKKKQKKKVTKAVPPPELQPKDFLDLIAPAAVRFNTDHYILGGTYRSALALRGYPSGTEELALLRRLGEKSGVTLAVDVRRVTAAEEDRIIHNAANKNRLDRSNTDDLKQSVTAQANLDDVAELVSAMHREKEPLVHCGVYMELCAKTLEELRALQSEVLADLTRSKLSADRLLLRQREGFLSANPAGSDAFGTQFERVLPAVSAANLFFFNYSGKTDPKGFCLGRGKVLDKDRIMVRFKDGTEVEQMVEDARKDVSA